jgi:hypothetical protein
MAQNKRQTFGPVALSTTLTTNIIAPAAAGAGGVGYTATATVILLRQIRVVNKGAAVGTFSLWLGATGANAAGTEIATAVPVAVGGYVDLNFADLRLEGTNGFLVGGASLATTLTLIAMGEVGLV